VLVGWLGKAASHPMHQKSGEVAMPQLEIDHAGCFCMKHRLYFFGTSYHPSQSLACSPRMYTILKMLLLLLASLISLHNTQQQ